MRFLICLCFPGTQGSDEVQGCQSPCSPQVGSLSSTYIGLAIDVCFFCLDPSSPCFWWLLHMVYLSSDGPELVTYLGPPSPLLDTRALPMSPTVAKAGNPGKSFPGNVYFLPEKQIPRSPFRMLCPLVKILTSNSPTVHHFWNCAWDRGVFWTLFLTHWAAQADGFPQPHSVQRMFSRLPVASTSLPGPCHLMVLIHKV